VYARKRERERKKTGKGRQRENERESVCVRKIDFERQSETMRKREERTEKDLISEQNPQHRGERRQ